MIKNLGVSVDRRRRPKLLFFFFFFFFFFSLLSFSIVMNRRAFA